MTETPAFLKCMDVCYENCQHVVNIFPSVDFWAEILKGSNCGDNIKNHSMVHAVRVLVALDQYIVNYKVGRRFLPANVHNQGASTRKLTALLQVFLVLRIR